MKSRQEIFDRIKATLVSEFEIEESKINEQSRFFEDLDLDSIDAVDLIVRLKNEASIQVSADDFKAIRTLGDLLDVLERLIREQCK